MFATRAVRVFAYGSPVDMRKGFEGLSALVRLGMNYDPLSGDLYLFVNRRRHRAKVLLWDGTGLCLYAKRLERGRFAALWKDASTSGLSLTITELQLFLEGSALVGRGSPPASILRAAETPARVIRRPKIGRPASGLARIVCPV